MATIILTGGGTAGHCVPNIALIQHLKNHFDKIYYIGSENGIEKQIITEQTKLKYFGISCAKLKRSITLKNLLIPFKVALGVKQAGVILDKLKPDVIFSKGGYVAVPVILAGKKRKIPIITHESDFTIGLANKITAKHCKKVLTSFPETAKTIKNGLYVGPPLKQLKTSKTTALNKFGLSGKKPVILVTGGSLGSQIINTTLREALPNLLKNFEILHICGKNNIDKDIVHNGYVQVEFVNDMKQAYSVADICVSRAGSNTLFELLSLKKPCVLIPLPKGASRGDQVLNAEYFQKKGVVYVLQQNALTPESLAITIESVYSNRKNIVKNLDKEPIINSCEKIAEILSEYANSSSKNM
jgi:UDP-N-acetylglucosamine--N-acetylmuramyl-(pentapeptide) pyrophosphoryl-undecaprenol N-acetylglucosamine transferase